jgi:hypothetical protein
LADSVLILDESFSTVIPERLVRPYTDALDLEVLAVPLDVGTFDEYLLHPAKNHADAGCVWLRRVLAEIAKSVGPLEPKEQHQISNRRRGKVVPGLIAAHMGS